MALYPSWIEIPVSDLERALAFYRAVFNLQDTPFYDDPPAQIAVLLPSKKEIGNPGVSLVQSPRHEPNSGGPQINFHMGTHAELEEAISRTIEQGGKNVTEIISTEDGMRYAALLDCEGNTFALSSYEDLEDLT